MEVMITGLQMDVGDSLKDHCAQRMEELTKYFEKITGVDVSMRHEKGGHHYAEVVVYASGINLRAIGDGTDFYGAVDDAAQKLAKQLQRYKGRLQKHRNRRSGEPVGLTHLPVYQSHEVELEEDDLENAPEALFAEYMPKIVRKQLSNVEPMSVDEAVMQMDLLHKPAFMFQNARTGALNMVYRDHDGTVRWVDPQQQAMQQAKAS